MRTINEYLELNEFSRQTFLIYRKGSSESILINEYENEVYQKLKQYVKPLAFKEIRDICNFNVDSGFVSLLDVMVYKKIIDVDIVAIESDSNKVDFVKVYSAD